MSGLGIRIMFCLALACTPVASRACSIPVFRYALERWESDRFQVIIYHRGALSVEQSAFVDQLEKQSVVQSGPLNVEVIRFDVDSLEPPKLLVAERPAAEQALPHVEIRTRTMTSHSSGVEWVRRWQGPLSAAIPNPGVFDSPVRQEIVRRILQGHSAVWLLVAPDAEKGKVEADALQESLSVATQSISLPQGIGLPGSELHAPVPLEIRFSVLTVNRHELVESRFLELIASHAAEWNEDTTYVVPIFGRCRALDVIPFADLNDSTIAEIGGFICAACSCQVKQANPGFDLLVSVNWEEKLFGNPEDVSTADPTATPETQAATQPRSGAKSVENPQYLDIPTGKGTTSSESLQQSVLSQPRRLLVVLGTLVIVAGGIAAVLFHK